MFPRISDLINYLFGTNIDLPVNSYGLMMAIAFIAGGLIIWLELRRKEREGLIHSQQKKVLMGGPPALPELLFTILFGFIIGWKFIGIILNYPEFSRMPEDYILSAKGSIGGALLLAVLLGGYTWLRMKKKQLKQPYWKEETVHPQELTPMILMVAAFFGIIGAKIFDMMEHLDDLIHDPVSTLLSFSGLTFYGGLIVASFAVLWYASRHKIRVPYMLDTAAPGLILAYAIGRIGCQLSGDGCWGVINTSPKPGWLGFLPDWMWSFRYPHNVIDEGNLITNCTGPHCHILGMPVLPTPFYETVLGLIIFGILWGLRKRLKIPGYLFCIYLILNGIERFFIERIRINRVYDVLGMYLTQAEIIAVFLVVIAIVGFWYFRMKNEKTEGLGNS
jgi:prolipoprotein diacylglyceryl transferase